MESGGEIKAHVHEFRKLEEIFKDKDGNVFDIVLSFGPIHELKSKIQTFKE